MTNWVNDQNRNLFYKELLNELPAKPADVRKIFQCFCKNHKQMFLLFDVADSRNLSIVR